MKKIFAILMALCLIVGAICITAFANDASEEAPELAPGTVLRVSALKNDGKLKFIEDYSNFKDGWNAAMKLADTEDYMEDNGYDRIVVDMHADWIAETGFFTTGLIEGSGFKWNTIYFQNDVKFTLNMNGHTIDRNRDYCISNGEVMYIDVDADVIINDGTIKGGASDNGAGGIHIMDDAKVTLNNVHIVDNKTMNDDGGGIALTDDVEFVMNGGSFKNNVVKGVTYTCYGGAIYMNDSTAKFDGVEFKNNVAEQDNHLGAAIYSDECKVTIKNCIFDGNGIKDDAKGVFAAVSTIHAIDSSITINKSTFTNNGALYLEAVKEQNGRLSISQSSTLIYLDDSNLAIEEDCLFSDNKAYSIINPTDDDKFSVLHSTFKNNASAVLNSADHDDSSYFRDCTFSNNKAPDANFLYTFNVMENVVTFYDCSFGNSTFDKYDADYIKYSYSTVPEEEALIRVTAILADGTTSFSDYHKNLETGWEAAMDAAATQAYDRVVVDLYADWNTPSGMDYVVTIPDNARVTFNMNNHTIDAYRSNYKLEGEVMYIGVGADVIINDGTITGGWSSCGAGGIEISEKANVVLNNVNVKGNKNDVSANGAGIAVFSGATLTMIGGSISENTIDGISYPCGILYVKDATVTLDNVSISDNYTPAVDSEGMAIYADNSTVTLNNCVVSDNATTKLNRSRWAESIISAYNSKLIITNTDFTGNGAISDSYAIDYSHLFYLKDSDLTLEGGKITGNNTDKIFYFDDSEADIKGVAITDNASIVLDVDNDSEKVILSESVLDNNSPVKNENEVIVEAKGTLVLTDCTIGDTTFEDKDLVDFSGKGVGSLFGQGSLGAILSLFAIAVSCTSIYLIFEMKKKGVAVAANSAEVD